LDLNLGKIKPKSKLSPINDSVRNPEFSADNDLNAEQSTN